MKKLINDPAQVVDDMLDGILRTRPGLALLEGQRVVLRADAAEMALKGKVALISGGGSGHEPAHAGYVGQGMLTAAVCGEVFTSPSTDAVLAAIRAVSGPAGVLLIVKNYTGDRLNFGMAAEMAREEGIRVEMLIVADDVALGIRNEDDTAGRRGIAGTVLIHKILGAAAEDGYALDALLGLGRKATSGLSTMGVALGTCTVPAAGKPNFALGADELEYGLGIHGEPGIRRGPMAGARVVMEHLAQEVFSDCQAGDQVALLINDLGATTPMELSVVTAEALNLAEKASLHVERVFSGRYLTALEMPGVSLSIMLVDDPMIALLDAPSQVWPAGVAPQPRRVLPADADLRAPLPSDCPVSTAQIEAFTRALAAIEEAEERLTEMDSHVGDGDIGINLARGARELRAALPQLSQLSLADLLSETGKRLRSSVGGTSGALYGVGLLRAAAVIREGDDLRTAFAKSAEAISQLGGAKLGDRTMLDAMIPAAEALTKGQCLNDAIICASHHVETLTQIAARRGRASYLGDRAIGHIDPGAHAVLLWLRAFIPYAQQADGTDSRASL